MRVVLLIFLFVFAVSYTTVAYLTVDRSNDETQIRTLVDRGGNAIQRRDLSDAMSCVSKDYKDAAGLNYERLRVLAAQALHTENNYSIKINTRSIALKGDEATLYIHVDAKNSTDGRTFYSNNLTVKLHKEKARHALIIPVKAWRVKSFSDLKLAGDGEGILGL